MQAKKMLMAVAAAVAAGVALADGMTIVEARKQIVAAIADPAVMTSTISQLSAEDQKQYLADVVAAVGKMPGSQEEAAAAYLNVCRAALKGSQKGNLATLLAEIFATVPVEYLPVVSESLGGDMLNRAANPANTYTDDQYLAISTNVMQKVNERLASEDAADVRSAFAALAFIRGSNSQSPAIVAAMTAALPESAQKPASEEWFPAALAEGDRKSYDPMLVAASADDVSAETMTSMLLRVSMSQNRDALLADIAGGGTDPTAGANEKTPITDAVMNTYTQTAPSLGDGGAFGGGGGDVIINGVTVPRGTGGSASKIPGGNVTPPPPKPEPYPYQTTH